MSYIEQYRKIFNGGKFLRNNKQIDLRTYAAFDGGGIRTIIDNIIKELETRKSVTILDWGCGTAIHWHHQTLLNGTQSIMNVLGEKIQGFYRYDPAVELYCKKPTCKYDFIVCSDVLEHIPDSELEDFFIDIMTFLNPNGIIFYSISTQPSKNSFVTGENMHINIKTPKQWFDILKIYSKCNTSVSFNGKYTY